MTLRRLGCFHQSRLSFMRVLLRQIHNWKFSSSAWQIDNNGKGYAVYRAKHPSPKGECYSLIAFAHEIDDDVHRSDRVIAEVWDASFTLFDGEPTEADINRLAKNVPKQEAGRISTKELALSRANRSVRLWQYVEDCLAKGVQPDKQRVLEVGYLVRTTAVYGSGKFGALDREFVENRELAKYPFALEMLLVYLIRTFVVDLVEYIAHIKGGVKAVKLNDDLRRCFGIGNSTGLGMAPFLINHPVLFSRWIAAKEQALLTVRKLKSATNNEVRQLCKFIKRAQINLDWWHSEHPLQIKKNTLLRADLVRLAGYVAGDIWYLDYPWHQLMLWSEAHLSEEGQEQLVSLLLEVQGVRIDHFSNQMHDADGQYRRIDGSVMLCDFKKRFEAHYAWAFDYDFTHQSVSARYWYVSESKLEPRVGERYGQDRQGASLELPIGIAREAQALKKALDRYLVDKHNQQKKLADFLAYAPEHRYMVRRVQINVDYPYSEICDNLLSSDMLPIDLLRCKLSFFGATHFDPRSDRWVRITMYQNAPYPHELPSEPLDDWSYPKEATG